MNYENLVDARKVQEDVYKRQGKSRRYFGNSIWKQKRPGRGTGCTGNSKKRSCQ